jgi:hypothetical protein
VTVYSDGERHLAPGTESCPGNLDLVHGGQDHGGLLVGAIALVRPSLAEGESALLILSLQSAGQSNAVRVPKILITPFPEVLITSR